MNRWTPLRHALAAAVGFVALAGPLLAPSPARAADPDAQTAALGAERARLRAQLDRVNAEIDALKRAGGVRDDYKLRARLADAESLARRLVDIDARLGLRAGTVPKPVPAPVAAPTDSPADLEAKADILADQARRLRAQADGYVKRAQDIKGRQELRRRAADLDRDPFAPMESSKRRVASASTAAPPVPGRTQTGGSSSPADSPSSTPPPSGSGAGPTGSTTTPSTPTGAGVTGGSFTGGNTTGTNTKTDTVAPTPSIPGSPTAVESTRGGSADMSLAVQLRDVLDTATLADIRKLEAGRSPGNAAQALDRAATALRDRAAQLEARARGMRVSKPAAPR